MELGQPGLLSQQHFGHHIVDLRQSTDGCGEWIEHYRVIHRVFSSGQRCLNNQFLNIDIRAIMAASCGGKEPT